MKWVKILVPSILGAALAAFLIVHYVRVDSARSDLKRKLAPFQVGIGDFTPKEALQRFKYLNLSIARCSGALSREETRQLQEILTSLADWSFFMEQPATAMRLTEEAADHIRRCGMTPHMVETSPELEKYLQMCAQSKVYSDLIRADQVPPGAAYQISLIRSYFQIYKSPPPARNDFYNPKECADLASSILSRKSNRLCDSLNHVKWF